MANGYEDMSPGEWREDANRITCFQPINRLASNNYTESAKIVRDTFKDYFNRGLR